MSGCKVCTCGANVLDNQPVRTCGTERQVFYIDVPDMTQPELEVALEKIKQELRNRKV